MVSSTFSACRLERGCIHRASREQLMHGVKKEKKRDEIENAAFRPGAAASDPGGPRQRRIRKMPRENHATIRNGIQKGLAKIEAGVHANCEPEASDTPQREAPEEPGHNNSRNAHPVLARIKD